MPKSSARATYEQLNPSDQAQVDISTGRYPGVLFTKDYPALGFDQAVQKVAGQPGAYTTKPGDVIRSSKLKNKAKGLSF